MRLVPPLDAIWLWAESAAAPTHVTGLQIFQPQADAPAGLLERLHAQMLDPDRLKPRFRLRPHRSLRTGGQFSWLAERDVDLSAHVVRVQLPAPGGTPELMSLAAEFHAERLERDRPLWQARLIGGLDSGGFALCTKVHHALFDGVSTSRHLLGGLSPDPAARDWAAPWQESRSGRAPARRRLRVVRTEDVAAPAPGVRERALSLPDTAARSAAAVTKAVLGRLVAGGDGLPFSAPGSRFNRPVRSARRFAGGSWSIDRVRAVARAADASSNDVVLALCGTALRAYLAERADLPAEGLTAMVPVSRRDRNATGGGSEGNDVAAVICPLATDQPDPVRRLARVSEVMRDNKELMAELDPVAAAGVSVAALGPVLAGEMFALPVLPRPPFNLVVSNVPGSPERLYLDGCELTQAYPMSVVLSGQALNITLLSYAGRLSFGVTGCRDAVPDPERLVAHLEAALDEVEAAYGLDRELVLSN